MAGAVLTKLTMHNYRCLRDAVIPFTREITVLTGQNDAGKTSTLDALESLLGVKPLAATDRSSGLPETEPVVVEGEFVVSGSSQPLLFRSVLDDRGNRREIKAIAHREFPMEPDDMSLPDLRAAIQRLGIPSPGGASKAPYVQAANTWIDGRPRDEFRELWRTAVKEELSLLPSLTRFDEAHVEEPIAHAQALLVRAARSVLGQEGYTSKLDELQQTLAADILPTLDEIRQKIRKHCPDIDDIEVTPIFDFRRPAISVSIKLLRGGATVPLETAGGGRRRRIAVAIHEASIESLKTGSSEEILAYDEPDMHLDYMAQRELFDILRRQSELGHVQVVVATHSLNFIDKVGLASLAHYRLNSTYSTIVETLTSTAHADELAFLQNVCVSLGLRNSALLSERCFLVVEGDTEHASVPVLYRKATGSSLVASGITLLNTKGSGAVRRLVEILRTEWNRDVVAMVDADARVEAASWLARLGLTERSDLYFIGTKEFEDAFTDEQWAIALNNSFPQGAGQWQRSDIAALRSSESFADDLCSLVRDRSTAAGATKPDLGYALAESVATNEIPTAIRHALEAASALAKR